MLDILPELATLSKHGRKARSFFVQVMLVREAYNCESVETNIFLNQTHSYYIGLKTLMISSILKLQFLI